MEAASHRLGATSQAATHQLEAALGAALQTLAEEDFEYLHLVGASLVRRADALQVVALWCQLLRVRQLEAGCQLVKWALAVALQQNKVERLAILIQTTLRLPPLASRRLLRVVSLLLLAAMAPKHLPLANRRLLAAVEQAQPLWALVVKAPEGLRLLAEAALPAESPSRHRPPASMAERTAPRRLEVPKVVPGQETHLQLAMAELLELAELAGLAEPRGAHQPDQHQLPKIPQEAREAAEEHLVPSNWDHVQGSLLQTTMPMAQATRTPKGSTASRRSRCLRHLHRAGDGAPIPYRIVTNRWL